MGMYQEQITQELGKRLGKPSIGIQQQQVNGKFQQPNQKFLDDDIEEFSNVNQLSLLRNSSIQGPGIIDPNIYSDDIIKCLDCKKGFYSKFDTDKIWFLVSCLHTFCRACLAKQINTEFINKDGQINCKSCSDGFQEYDFNEILGKTKMEDLQQKLLMKQFNLVQCIACKDQFAFEVGKLSKNVKNDKGQIIDENHENHYINNRFMCQNSNCKTEQCKSCQAHPYHLGFTCEEYGLKQSSKRCRYCDETILQVDKTAQLAYQDICKAEECQQKKLNACDKILQCGHACLGIKGEFQCMPCLHEDCAEGNEDILKGQSGADYCNICYVESLSSAPCIRSKCGHIFHHHCMKKKLEVKWLGARINFNFCLCPLCKQWLEFPIESSFFTQMNSHLIMFEDLKNKSHERLKFEERMKDQKLVDPNSNFYQKPIEYGIAIYAYYLCFKCKKPYFGGHKDCQQNMEDGNKEFKPEELVCANCCDIPIDNCPKHGKEFIEFKCKFCCSIAQWFCWGTTHFCEPCHKRQCAGDYVSKYTVDKLPKCPGKDKCVLKCEHKPNGNECSLGCSICRNIKDNAREF